MTEAERVANWNDHHPVGTPVYYRPIAGEADERPTKTRSEAWLLGGHTAVVMVDGIAGGVAVSHCRPREHHD
jgi:hypothetical protein